MPRRFIHPQRALLTVLSLALLALGAVWAGGERGLPVENGILNFGKINEHLYRGAQPDTNGIGHLQKLGIKNIINLRMPDDIWKSEGREARAVGISYTNLPIHALGRPTDEQVREVLSVIESLQGPVFIHCQHGCDRTGTIIACYRIRHDGWSYDAALREAERYGLSPLERGMRDYIRDYAKAAAQPR